MKASLQTARTFAKLMDAQWSFFGIRFGLENIIGLVPGGGDALTLLLSGYLLLVGVQMKLPRTEMQKMFFNLAADVVIGFVPIVGDISDIFFKANMRNLAILERFAAQDNKELQTLSPRRRL